MYTTDLVPFFLLINRYYARMLTRVAPEEWQALEAYSDHLGNRLSMVAEAAEAAEAADAAGADAPAESDAVKPNGVLVAAAVPEAGQVRGPAGSSPRLPDKIAERITSAIARIAMADAEDAVELEYEFNRLFLGPDKPQAAPYETVYLSTERVLMRTHTLSVREAYARQGFEVNAKNTEPDDHAAYECAFAAALLERQDAQSQAAFEDFMEQHMARWVNAHTTQIRAHTANAICLGFADLFDAVVAGGCA